MIFKFFSNFRVSSILDVLWPDSNFWFGRRSAADSAAEEQPGILDKPRPLTD